MKKDKKAPEDQENLFGEGDHLFNVIEETRSDIAAEIKRCEESIDKKQEQIDELARKMKELNKARETAKKLRDKEAEEKKKK